jgi:RNA polymerase sigma-70 factor (ECF subfamily)
MKTSDQTSESVLNGIVPSPNDDAWRRFDDLYRPLLRAWTARVGVPASDVDDLVQDILLVVFRKVAEFTRRGQGSFRAWLRTILANRVGDYWRRQKHAPTATGDSDFLHRLRELESPGSALSRLWDLEHHAHVATSLMQQVQGDFTPTTWQAFRRHALEGEPAARVAEELRLSLNAVLLAKSRVLKRLRQEAAGLVD